MIAVDLTEELLRSVEFREIERADLGDNLTQDHVDFFMSSQYKKAVLKDSEVVMAMGGNISGKNCNVWIIASERIFQNPIASLEMIMRLENEATQIHKVRYLYTHNLPEFPFAIKFLKRIGYREFERSNDFPDGKERVTLFKEVNHGCSGQV